VRVLKKDPDRLKSSRNTI